MTDKKFHIFNDKSFKLSLLLKKIKWVNNFIFFCFNSIINVIKVILKFKKKNKTKVINIISFHRLGDTVFTIPTIKEIIKNKSNYKIFIYCYQDSKSIYSKIFKDDQIIAIDKKSFKIGRHYIKREGVSVFNKTKPEIIFDLTGTTASAQLILSSNAREVYGINNEYFKSLYDIYIPIREKPHFMDLYFDIIKRVFPSNYPKSLYEFELSYDKSGYILIQPFAIRKSKEWDLKKFINLSILLNKNYNVEIIAQLEHFPYDLKKVLEQYSVKVTLTKTLDELINKIKMCSLFISNDTGPTYIASLFGKPTFAIYGPTNSNFSVPFGEYHRVYTQRIKCSAEEEKVCFTLGGIYCPTNECMKIISVKNIYLSIISFLKKCKIKNRDYIISGELN